VDAMAMVGVPYGDAVNKAPAMARAQAQQIAAAITEQGGPAGLEDKQIIAMVAYMQRLGRDIKVTATADNSTAARRATTGGTN
jgi:cbb3-type cytochrome oxidase cytochrome c subunit